MVVNMVLEVLIYLKLVFKVLPVVNGELDKWKRAAEHIPDTQLQKQALSSMSLKKFHCVGGSVFGLFSPENLYEVVKAIVAIQTISDYLDNLCDRVILGETGRHDLYETFMELHEAMMCAVEPDRPMIDFYRTYPLGRKVRDGGYLAQLVHASRKSLDSLKNYDVVKPVVSRLSRLYCELQATKHLAPSIREERMKDWWEVRWVQGWDDLDISYVDVSLKWWEFGAACGSTLGIFCMIAYAGFNSANDETAVSLYQTYFPIITGLHILLDYFIDMEEDKISGDLNFVSYFGTYGSAVEAISSFAGSAMEMAGESPVKPWFHRSVVRGLLAMYLSDRKVSIIEISKSLSTILSHGGGITSVLCKLCRLVRVKLGF